MGWDQTSKVDSHVHVWDLTLRDQPWTAAIPELHRTFGYGELAAQLAPAGVGGTILVQTVTTPDETPELLALTLSHPQILGVVGWASLEDGDLAGRIEEFVGAPGGDRLVGIRHQVQEEPDSDYLRRPAVLGGLRTVEDADLTYDLVLTEPHWDAALDAVRATPGLRFVVDHAGKPPIRTTPTRRWQEWITELAGLENVAVKLSGLFTEASQSAGPDVVGAYVDHLLTSFGSRRVLFGSDWPVSTLRGEYAEIVEATRQLLSAATSTQNEDVFRRSATEWYRLEKHGHD